MKQADRKIVKEWSRQQMQANRQQTLRIAFLGLLNVGVGMVQIHALASFLAALLLQQKHILAHALTVFTGASLLRIILGFLQEITALSAGQTARRRLRSVILARIQAIGPSLLRQHHSSTIAELLVERIEALEGYFSRWLPASALCIIAQWSVVFVVLLENTRAGVILALCCLFLPVFQAVFGLATAITSQRQFLAMSRLQTRFLDRVKGIATLVLSGNIESEIQALSDSAEELRKRTMRVLRVAFLASATTDVTMTVALVGIVISQAHILYHTNSLPLATKALFAVLVVPEAFAPFRALSAAYQDRAQAQAAAEAMHKLPEKHFDQSKEHISASCSPALPSLSQNGISLSVQDVSYRWTEDRPPALSHLSFNLEAGQTMILEGASGSGKSTLIELVLGFISPQQGRILLQGVDTSQLSASEKIRHISWIGQKPVLFAGSLRDNVLFACPDASETELKAALDAAHVSDYLPLLPQGLETMIGEGGFGLSGGQAQRIAVARAYLKNAPLLLLDEPTAHLDPETEADLLLSLQKLLKGRTALISTHSTQYDKIGDIQKIRLEKGHIIKNRLSGKNV